MDDKERFTVLVIFVVGLFVFKISLAPMDGEGGLYEEYIQKENEMWPRVFVSKRDFV